MVLDLNPLDEDYCPGGFIYSECYLVKKRVRELKDLSVGDCGNCAYNFPLTNKSFEDSKKGLTDRLHR